ncbi:hypothetical protein BJ165DRAFT_1553735 [Panaeolus papilionaceus]|nr:hypothetical protein BJ165DRAFT_1553735 [Panaeolus papilionaceus]
MKFTFPALLVIFSCVLAILATTPAQVIADIDQIISLFEKFDADIKGTSSTNIVGALTVHTDAGNLITAIDNTITDVHLNVQPQTQALTPNPISEADAEAIIAEFEKLEAIIPPCLNGHRCIRAPGDDEDEIRRGNTKYGVERGIYSFATEDSDTLRRNKQMELSYLSKCINQPCRTMQLNLPCLNDIIAKKSTLAAIPITGLIALILQDLKNLQTAIIALENALLGAVPVEVQSQAAATVAAINNAFANAIAAYS